MMTKSLLKVLVITVVGCSAFPSHSQGNEIVQETVIARSASGTVYGGRKEYGNLLKDVRVLQCDAKFQSCKDVAKTDEGGKYNLPTTLTRLKVVYLEFLLPGFDQVELTVRVHRIGPNLEVRLPLGA